MAKQRRRRLQSGPFLLPPTGPQYPAATIAYYGPDDRTPTKIVVGIVDQANELLAMESWTGPGVTGEPKTLAKIQQFIEANGAKTVVMSDGVIGCPHEEGIDYPEGEECPLCPFWQGKQ